MQIQHKRVYNLEILGGNPFQMGVEANFPVEHDGVKSVGVQLLLSAEQYLQFKKKAELFGCEVVHNEVITDEEREEIREVMERLRDFDPEKLPTSKCAMCALCDVVSETRCGIESWQPGFLSELVRVNEKARADLDACPLEKKL